ncbi:MAG: 3-deoxy-7-phosphoheptulonate synthase, partial [Acidobacteria bacterium]|nr:3-deoxy-7-phosphoheptulonate synthase [Acidobacteriota bacterium]
EWLLAAEHCFDGGASGVIFCERGIRSFDPHTRNVLDLGAVALLSTVYRHPVVVDPSHAAGRRDLVLPLARAALAAGACGLLVETHPDPGRALSDGPQEVDLAALAQLAAEIDAGSPAGGRR